MKCITSMNVLKLDVYAIYACNSRVYYCLYSYSFKPISAPGHSGASYKGATTYVANGVGIY